MAVPIPDSERYERAEGSFGQLLVRLGLNPSAQFALKSRISGLLWMGVLEPEDIDGIQTAKELLGLIDRKTASAASEYARRQKKRRDRERGLA